MGAEPVVPGLWKVKIRFVNAYLLDTGDGLTLIDTGIAGSAPTILEAVRSIGRQPADIRRILVAHCYSFATPGRRAWPSRQNPRRPSSALRSPITPPVAGPAAG